MKNKNILVISNKWDAHADSVIKEIQNYGTSVIRINTEDFRKNEISFDMQRGSKNWHIRTPEGRIISQETIYGVYIRRLSMPIDVSDIQADFQNFAQRESLSIVNSLGNLLEDAIWLNRINSRESASNKIWQLMAAQTIGFAIPETLITNNSEQAKNFCTGENTIYKTLECPMLDHGDKGQSMINTSVIPENTDFSSINLAPTLLQHYVQKAYELRIHIIDTEIITVKIDSQKHPDTKIDWRVAQKELHYERVDIPEYVKQKLFQLMSQLHIQFGIIDMIVTEGGDYVFLEINPDGNWLWIEQKIHVPISKSIALYFLKNRTENYEQTS